MSQWGAVYQMFMHDYHLACRFWRTLQRRRPGGKLFPEMRLCEVLDERELDIIARRFIHHDTLRETGLYVNLGPERVRQLERQMLVKLVRAWRQEKYLKRPVNWQTPIANFPLSTRLHSCLWCENIETLADLIGHSRAYFRRVPNMGRKTQNELFEFMDRVGIHFRAEEDEWSEHDKRETNRWPTEGAW